MKACLTKVEFKIWFFLNGSRIEGRHKNLSGDVSWLSGDVSGLRGDVSWLSGDVRGLSGDVSGLRGNVSGLRGDLGESELTDRERSLGVDLAQVTIQPPKTESQNRIGMQETYKATCG